MEKREHKLTPREYCIYDEIKNRSLEKKWTSVQYLADMLGCCKREVRRSIQRIRESSLIQKIILTDYQKGYRLMNDEDEFEMLMKTKIKILKELKRYWKDVERYNLNNQTKITFTKYERDFYESILNVSENKVVDNQ